MKFAATVAATAALALAGSAAADECKSLQYGAPGAPTYKMYTAPTDLPGYAGGREPTIGINWKTGSVFFQAVELTLRIRFDEEGEATWENVTPLYAPPTNLDPMLYTDQETGRVFSGGLAGPCSIMLFSDDDGETWLPAGNMCTGAQFDHQSIASGPPSQSVIPFPAQRVYYYCAQLVLTACTSSYDGGLTWAPPTYITGGCGGLHGHIRVSELTGTAVVGHKNCGTGANGAEAGFGYTDSNGLLWQSRQVAGSFPPTSYGDDPSMAFSRPSNLMWFALADNPGAYVAMSRDEGLSWEKLGGGMGVEPTTYLELGQFHEPAIVAAEMGDIQAGDDERVAYTFFGLLDKDGDGTAAEFPDVNQCDSRQDEMVWYYFIALTYDTGNTWLVQKMVDDVIQVGGIAAGICRNLLDFQDMDIDITGRPIVGTGDGCVGDCEIFPSSGVPGYRAAISNLIRMDTGRGLFAGYDKEGPLPQGCNVTDPALLAQPQYDYSELIAQRAEIAKTITPASYSSCSNNCGLSTFNQARSGCGCNPFANNKCADYAEICTPQNLPVDEAESVAAVEVKTRVTYGNMGDWEHHKEHYIRHLADSFRVAEERVRIFSADHATGETVSVVYLDDKFTPTQYLSVVFDEAKFLADAPVKASGYQFTNVRARIVNLRERSQTSRANAGVNAQHDGAAPAHAAESSVHPAAYVVPAVIGSVALGAAAAVVLTKKAGAAKADLSSQDQLA